MTIDIVSAPPSSLRDRMRLDTADLHAALDARLGAFDLRDPADLAGFLRINERGFAAIAGAGPDGAVCMGRSIAADLARRIRSDLDRLGTSPLPAVAAPEDPDPLAIDYVVLGSRLGSSVLKRHWAQAEDPRVREASCYFSAPAQVRRWQAFCRQTREMSPKNAAADRAVDDTRRIFALFNDHNSSDARPRAHDT